MTGIKVIIEPAALQGALEPRYDEESRILAAESPVSAEWPFGVDIDGRMVFDLGPDRTLMNFDLHVGCQLWEEDPRLSWPAATRRGRLVFAEEAIATKSFNLPLRVTTDRECRLVRIDIGSAQGGTPIAISNDCVALQRNGDLVGFVVRLL